MKAHLTAVFMIICIPLFCIVCSLCAPQPVRLPSAYEFKASTAIVSIFTIETESIGLCIAGAFVKNKNKYLFFTDAHCMADYEKETGKTFLKRAVVLLVLEGKDGGLLHYPAKILAVGEMKNLEDLAILEVESDEDIPIIPLSKFGPELDEDVRIVTAPFGPKVGFLYLRGYVSKEKLGELPEVDNVNISGTFLAQIIGLGTAEGASGGRLLSVKRGEIIGICKGSMYNDKDHISLSFIPIAKFNNFYKEYLEGKRPLSEHIKVEPKKDE